MKLIKLFLNGFVLLSVGCTYTPFMSNLKMFNGIDSSIQPYFDRFYSETGISPYFVSAGFTTSIETDNFVGECAKDEYQAEIRIDPNYWAGIDNDDILKEQIIFHELGHCVLNEGHIFDVNPYTGQPLSIMYPVVFNYEEGLNLEANEPEYVQALVQNRSIYP